MKTIETEVTVTADGRLVMDIAFVEVPPGHYRAIVVLETTTAEEDEIEDFPVIEVGQWLTDISLHREDMYGENISAR